MVEPSPQTPPKGAGSPLKSQPQPKLAKVPQNKQEAAREAFLDTVLNAKSIAVEMWEDFRASDRFFKYKAAVLATWLALTGVTLVIACPSADQGPSNDLGAKARIQESSLENARPALLVDNTSDEDWGDLLLKLNNVYSASYPGVKAGRTAVVPVYKFIGPDGRSPPESMKLQRLEVRSSSGGVAIIDLNESKH